MSNVLKVNWSYGFNKNITNGVHSLSNSSRNAIFFLSSHSGVIYDFEHRTQMILQGHCNVISCCAVSADKRWIVTADTGDDTILVVWDSLTGSPVKTIFSPHLRGVKSVDISGDSLYIATLSEAVPDQPQEVAIWAWTKQLDEAALRKACPTKDPQNVIRFDASNSADVVTTGHKSVCFWNWTEFALEVYLGRVSRAELGPSKGDFVSTVFLSGSGNALTTTTKGAAILWESQFASVLMEAATDKQVRSASKVITLVECAINFVATLPSGYIAIAGEDGSIKFYDFNLRLEAWFEDLAAGPVTSISFGLQQCPFKKDVAGSPGLKFWVPDFMVGTKDAFIVGVEALVFDEVRPEDRRGTLLMQGLTDYVSAVACHPSRSLVAFSSHDGSLQIWDYDTKLLMNLREFNNRDKISSAKANSAAARLEARNYLRPQCVAFEPNGEFLAVGFTSGHVKFLSVETFVDIASYAPSTDSVFGLQFSKSGVYMACYDSSHHVLLWKKSSHIDPATLGDEAAQDNGYFFYLGRSLSHGGTITGLEFGEREGMETLVSIGEDRRCVEYNLEASTVLGGVRTMDDMPTELDLNARPTALLWNPKQPVNHEDKFVVANDEYKFKEFNCLSKQCRKTTIAPTYGGPPNKMLPIATNGVSSHYAYSTASKVIGLGCLPVTGNPAEVMGLVAHPAEITSLAATFDGKFLFSAGGHDLSVNMWLVETAELVPFAESKTLEEETDSFLTLLEGGKDGALHNDIIDYFYYCQLRTQGEDAMETRAITGKIPVGEIPSLMRAVGFYPSEAEVNNMVSEVRLSTWMQDGLVREEINLADLLKLYINHRPVLPLNNAQISNAFDTLCGAVSNSGDGQLMWAELKKLLVGEGESIAPTDLQAYLTALIGDEAKYIDGRNRPFDARKFSDEILGFEDMR
jgi:WD40 repeat protein